MYDPFYDPGIDMWYVWGGDNDQTGPYEDVETLIVTDSYPALPENRIYIDSINAWNLLLDSVYADDENAFLLETGHEDPYVSTDDWLTDEYFRNDLLYVENSDGALQYVASGGIDEAFNSFALLTTNYASSFEQSPETGAFIGTGRTPEGWGVALYQSTFVDVPSIHISIPNDLDIKIRYLE